MSEENPEKLDALDLALALNVTLYQLILSLDEETRQRMGKNLDLWLMMADTHLKQFEGQFSADDVKRYVQELRQLIL